MKNKKEFNPTFPLFIGVVIIPWTILFLALITLISCSSTTHITTAPNDAKIYHLKSGNLLGTGSAQYQDSKVWWGRTRFRVERAGCRDKTLLIKRGHKFKTGRFIASFLLFWPTLFWCGDYLPSYGVNLECD